MKRKASIISLNVNTNKIIHAFKNSNRYTLEAIMDEKVDFNLLKEMDSIFIDSYINPLVFSEVEKFCLENNKEMSIFANSINIRKSKIKAIDDLCFLNLNPYKIGKFNSFIKRLFDILFSIFFIIISFPLFIIIILLIKIFDSGPVFYLQRRITKDEKEFIIYKFRTMKVNAEKETGAILSSKNDPRLTKIGRFLRKTRLDEIPQIFNVLNSDMSIVGPRPERRHFITEYKNKDDYYKYRFNVKAGITGYAQIYAHYDSSYQVKLDYDLYYISNYSFFKDIKIILLTAIFALKKEKVKNYKKNKSNIPIKEYNKWKKDIGKN